MVVKRGTNDAQILADGAALPAAPAIVLRFIEYMDVGATNGWRMDEVLPSAEVIAPHRARSYPLRAAATRTHPARPPSAGATADGGGEIGVISSVTQAFCHDCNRARLSTEGKLFLCLFATHGHDLRALLRSGYSDDRQIAAAIGDIWHGRDDRYSELRGVLPMPAAGRAPRRDAHIGG